MISQIGKYTVEAEIGSGGFGRVYKAWDPDVQQPVAIKVLLAEGDADLLKRFQLEVVTTASLRHKNIVTIYASGEEAGTPYLVMELLEGQTLNQIIKQRIPLTVMEKVRIMTQVAEGLAYANSKGVVHRDVKPANIMLQSDGTVKIMDFGIALAANQRTMGMTMAGFVVGTMSYMSPEQFTSDGKATEQSDIFAFGEVYYELLTGGHPFEASIRDVNALRVALLTYDPPAVGQLVPECPEALELVVHRSLAKEREFRYHTFQELRLDSASVLVDLEHQQATRILSTVPGMVDIGDLEEARLKVREAQRLEPGNRQARQLLDTIDQKLREKLNPERIRARLSEAESHISERRFAEAVQSLEAAAKLNTTNVMVQMRLADARAKRDGAAQANRLVEEARAKQQRGGLAEALERLDRAIQIDPEHSAAKRLRPKLSEQLARSQREAALLREITQRDSAPEEAAPQLPGEPQIPKKPISWKLPVACFGMVAVIVAAALAPRLLHKPAIPKATIAIGIRTELPAATVLDPLPPSPLTLGQAPPVTATRAIQTAVPADRPPSFDSANRAIQQRIEPRQTAHLDRKDVAPTPTTPPPPTAEMLEEQQWDRVRATSDFEQLKAFLRSFPNGTHAKEAEAHIADFEWRAVDQTNIEAVRKFLKDNPANPHHSEGQKIVDQFMERTRLELAKQEASARQEQLGKQQVIQAVNQLATAIQGKKVRDVKAIWPGTSPLFLESVGRSGAKMSLTAREEDVRFLQPDRATVQCNLVSIANGITKAQKATLILHNSGGAWTVENAKFE